MENDAAAADAAAVAADCQLPTQHSATNQHARQRQHISSMVERPAEDGTVFCLPA